jgi:hypothetical protein
MNKKKSFLLLLIFFINFPLLSQVVEKPYLKTIESNLNYSIIECDFSNSFSIIDSAINGINYSFIIDNDISLRKPGEPFIPNRFVQFGIPFNSTVSIQILETKSETFYNKFILPTPDSMGQPINKLNYDFEIYSKSYYFPEKIVDASEPSVFRYARFQSLMISPVQFNPVERKLLFNYKIKFKVNYVLDQSFPYEILSITDDRLTNEFISSQLINKEIASNFSGKIIENHNIPVQNNYWYNPNKDWYKIYLNKRGVYRITFDQLVQLGIDPIGQLRQGKLELFNNGQKIPIDIVDNNSDGNFNSGDYFQFVGEQVNPTPFSGFNIYNLSNVYWFSYQADSLYQYKLKNGFPENTFFPVISSITKLRWEEDKIMIILVMQQMIKEITGIGQR